MRLFRRFRRYPGRLLFGWRVAAPPRKALPGFLRTEFFDVFHIVFELPVGDAAYLPSQVPASHHKLARHMTAVSLLRYFRSMPQVVRRAAALGCCAAYPSSLKVIVGSSQDTSHDLAFSSVFVGVFFFCGSPCCVVCTVLSPDERWIFSFRSTSRWSIGAQSSHRVLIFPVPCRVVSIWPPWSSMFDSGLLLSCSRSTSLDSAFFAAESASSYHQDTEITLERERCGPS